MTTTADQSTRRAAFDRELRAKARAAGDAAFDPEWGLVAEPAVYNPIHTRIWTGIRHSHRDSVQYALALLETDESERAEQVLLEVIDHQDTDESSSTYGLWSYYREEPLDRMAPPDWNWADFLGRDLAFVLLRHEERLRPDVRTRVLNALRHAASSIVRRNVAMSYTNIAAKGTFVTLAAGQLLHDPGLTSYAVTRVGRLVAQVREAGSFAEYNSPSYWAITVEAMTAITQFITHPEAVNGAHWLVERLWAHLVRRWHSPTGQLSGPMARAYTNDQARNANVLALLAKAAAFSAPFDRLPPIPAAIPLVVPALLDVQVPEIIRETLHSSPAGLTREQFSLAPREGKEPLPVAGTTWRGHTATIGSASTSEFWLQRRPLLGYWTDPDDQPWHRLRYAQLRVLKNDFDFASAIFDSVQHGPHVLWSMSMKSPGGDEHLHLHPLEAGQPVRIEDLRLRLDLVGVDDDALVTVRGEVVTGRRWLEVGDEVQFRTRGAEIAVTIGAAKFGKHPVAIVLERADDGWQLSVVLLDRSNDLILLDIGEAFVVGTVSLADQTMAVSAPPVAVTVDDQALHASWTTPDGVALTLRSVAAVGSAQDQIAVHCGQVDGMEPDLSTLA